MLRGLRRSGPRVSWRPKLEPSGTWNSLQASFFAATALRPLLRPAETQLVRTSLPLLPRQLAPRHRGRSGRGPFISRSFFLPRLSAGSRMPPKAPCPGEPHRLPPLTTPQHTQIPSPVILSPMILSRVILSPVIVLGLEDHLACGFSAAP